MKSLVEVYYRLLCALASVQVAALLVPVSLQIVSRYTSLIPTLMWTEEAARFCLVWLVLVGSAIAVRRGMHFDIDLLPEPRTPRGRALARLVVDLLVLGFASVFGWIAAAYALGAANERSEITELPMVWMYAAFPVAAFGWMLFLIERVATELRVFTGRQR